MKKSFIIFAVLLTFVATISCERTALDLGAPLTVSKTTSIQKGEAVNFSFESNAINDKITWKVIPSQKVIISALGKRYPPNHVLALKDFALRSSVATGYGIDWA